MHSSLKILTPCEHRLTVDGHLWCSHPRVSIDWSGNFLTTDPLGRKLSSPVRCANCAEQHHPQLDQSRTPPEKFVCPIARKHRRHWRAPRWYRRAKNFLRAALLHLLRGSPHCTAAELAARQSICTQNICGFYRDGICSHTRCGCGVSRQRGGKKPHWADQECPIGLWPKVQWRWPWRR